MSCDIKEQLHNFSSVIPHVNNKQYFPGVVRQRKVPRFTLLEDVGRATSREMRLCTKENQGTLGTAAKAVPG